MKAVTQRLDRRFLRDRELMTLSGIDPDPSIVQPVTWSLRRLSYSRSVYLKMSSLRITCTGPNQWKLMDNEKQNLSYSIVIRKHSGMLRRRLVYSDVLKDLGTLTFQSLPVTWCTNSLTFNSCRFCLHCIYVFCIYLRTNSNLCHLQHKLIGFYNRDEKCLLRGTNWVFN